MPEVYAYYQSQMQWVDSSLLTNEPTLALKDGQVQLTPFNGVGTSKIWSYGGKFSENQSSEFRTVTVSNSISYQNDKKFTLQDPVLTPDSSGDVALVLLDVKQGDKLSGDFSPYVRFTKVGQVLSSIGAKVGDITAYQDSFVKSPLKFDYEDDPSVFTSVDPDSEVEFIGYGVVVPVSGGTVQITKTA